ncbi:MAG: hypothetical protein IIA67_03965 [Planctomycetes bacterium]|nr:hypothetical protein [Planctomycetota bacterium]
MTDGFDPYHSWLGIPPRHQPPNHYRLLGLQMFESDVDVIANTASRQMSHVRTFQTGQHAALSQQILNEIAAAKVCLLNPQKKASYDEQLRGKQPQQQHKRRAPAVQMPVVVTAASSHSTARPSAKSSRGGASRRGSSRSKKPFWTQPLAIAAACSLIVVSLIVVVIISTSAAPKQRQEVARRETNKTPKPDSQPTNRETRRGSPPAQGNPPKTSAAAPSPPDLDNQPANPNAGRVNPPAQDDQRKTGNAVPVTPKPPDGKFLIRPGAPGPIRVRPATEPPLILPKKTAPQKTEPGKPDPQVPDPPPSENPQQAPLPNKDAVRAAEGEISELFGLDKPGTPAAKRKIASEILQAASDEKQRTPDHFALLRTARDVAASAGDLSTALAAIQQIAAVYDVDAWELKLSAAQRATRLAGPAKNRAALVNAIVSLVDPAIAADRYQIATSLASLATSTARPTRDRDLIRRVAAVLASVKKRQQEFDTTVAPALAALKANADDSNAHLLVGKFRCFVQGDWKRGLPHLARGSDSGLKNAAVADLANPTEPEKRAAVGDGWWDLAQRAPSDEQGQVQARARHWYRRSATGLVGLRKLRVNKRIEQLDALKVPEVHSSERAELAKLMRRKEPSKGMIGTVSVDGVDTGILLTYRPGTRLDVEKIRAAVARQGIKGKSMQFRFYGAMLLKEDSRLRFWLESGKDPKDGKTKLWIDQRVIAFSSVSSNDDLAQGVYLLQWMSMAGKMNDDSVHITRTGEQIDTVFTRQMLATLKASRAKALVDVSGVTSKEAIEELKKIGATFIRADVFLNETAITDEQLKLVGTLRGLRTLEMKKCPNITGAGLRHLKHLSVITLNVSDTAIGDESLKHLKNQNNLWQLNLSGTKVTSEGLKHLHQLPSLRKLWLPSSKSQISDESVAALQQARPKCKIYR